MWPTTVAQAPPQQPAAPPSFPFEEFKAREETARWLVRYDQAAWKSSDLVMQAPRAELERLGAEWYCKEDGRTWDCYYGKYDPGADRYTVVFHYRSTAEQSLRRVDDLPSVDEATPYGRALYRSLQVVPEEMRKATFAFNPFVRKTSTGQIEVWHLPAWQSDGTLVYGGDLCQTLDATGTKVLETTFNYSKFRSTKPNAKTDLRIDNDNLDLASVGNLFFVLAYGSQFKSVIVVGRRFVTSRPRTDSGEVWMHLVRSQEARGSFVGVESTGPRRGRQ